MCLKAFRGQRSRRRCFEEGSTYSKRTLERVVGGHHQRTGFVIVGYQPSLKGRAFAIDDGGSLDENPVYRGNVGTGFQRQDALRRSPKLSKIQASKAGSWSHRLATKGAKWVEPETGRAKLNRGIHKRGRDPARCVSWVCAATKRRKTLQAEQASPSMHACAADASGESSLPRLRRDEGRVSSVPRHGR